jgi:cytochrome P450
LTYDPLVTAASVDAPLAERLDALLAGRPDALAEPFALYRTLRERSRVYAHGPMMLLTHYDDVKLVARDAERFSSRALVEGSRIEAGRTLLDGEALAAFDEVIAFCAHFPSRADGAEHARLRGAAHRAFTPARIAALEETTRRILADLLAPVPVDEPVDFMDVAFRLPLLVVAELLGVPREDAEMIHGWSVRLGAANASTEGGPYLAARDALGAFRTYVDGLIEQNRRAPGSDLVSLLMNAYAEDALSRDELAALFVQVLFAGHETTTTLIAGGIAELLGTPDQWRALGEDPSVIPNAVEELLRLVTPSQFANRLAVRDDELAGVAIPAGTTLIAVLAAANRDPAVFEDPDRCDIHRPDLGKQLAFGFGPHFCLGASLARLEARVVLETLAPRHPNAELAADELRWTGGAMLRALEALPLRLGTPS